MREIERENCRTNAVAASTEKYTTYTDADMSTTHIYIHTYVYIYIYSYNIFIIVYLLKIGCVFIVAIRFIYINIVCIEVCINACVS